MIFQNIWMRVVGLFLINISPYFSPKVELVIKDLPNIAWFIWGPRAGMNGLTLPMLRLLSSKAQRH